LLQTLQAARSLIKSYVHFMIKVEDYTEGLELGADGIWYAKNSEPISYSIEGNDACFAIEENSFWFTHRNRCITKLVTSFPPTTPTIFDVGGGNGFVAKALETLGFNVVLVEPMSGVKNAKMRGLKNIICASTNTATFKKNSLPAVGLFDVLEHIEDDASFIKQIHNLLNEEGKLYITVPAYNLLWSNDDISAGHFRRHTTTGLRQLLESQGFKVDYTGYFFWFLPLAIGLFKALPYRLGFQSKHKAEATVNRDHATGSPLIKKAVDLLLGFESSIIGQKFSLPFGGSCLVAATKINNSITK
jgi:SAM-dependent methyltransferase